MGKAKSKLSHEECEKELAEKITNSKLVAEAKVVSEKITNDMPSFFKNLGTGFIGTLSNIVVAIFWKLPIWIFWTPFRNAFRSQN